MMSFQLRSWKLIISQMTVYKVKRKKYNGMGERVSSLPHNSFSRLKDETINKDDKNLHSFSHSTK
jgi:hypothetical protein